MSVQEIEAAAKELPSEELDSLLSRLSDFIQDRWDQQIEADLKNGRFDALIDELTHEYKQGLTKPL
ncbi:hypothetical protein [Spirosoma sp. KUDC1026]|uniref:hypothetical protein n=1 Tax=Spirosoma sp. KUDC1026 TaxID=2745947 RepID=UPI00159BC2CA|nr:hypothetical protein [Spirosoma sp. KUDC1026]QKZ15040.1 hypothetical protein HU175_21415 [Spirosoma sp. KUDC1026]